MYAREKLIVTTVTAIGVWTNLYINLKRQNECKYINEFIKRCQKDPK